VASNGERTFTLRVRRMVGSRRVSRGRGTTTEGREALRSVLEFLHAGDVLMVTRIDRLARSIGDLQEIVRTVRARGAVLKATEQPIDTGPPPVSASSRSAEPRFIVCWGRRPVPRQRFETCSHWCLRKKQRRQAQNGSIDACNRAIK
jgi:hypothetical protein